MATWNPDELTRLAEPDELRIAPVRRNGELRTPTTIWAVRAGEELYVRAAYGPATGWYRVASTGRRARISAGGVQADVSVEEVDGAALDEIDAAYRSKYGGRYARNIVDSVIDEQARSSTLRLRPASG